MTTRLRLALYQPDIPQNAGTLLRTAACLDVGVDIIEPCGFVFSDRHLRRAGLDYLEQARLTRHASWQAFLAARRRPGGGRIVLLTTAADAAYGDFRFDHRDVLLVGRESAGVPAAVHDAVDARLRIPMAPGARALNVAVAAAMGLGEALRQTAGLADDMAAAAPRRAAS
jgi:tRNA (cytidine/uridine-2'-O-)-methyltransferase